MSDQPSAVEAVKAAESKPPTFGQKLAAFLLANWKPCAMVVLVVAGYLTKKFLPMNEDEAQLLEGLWLALGLGAVFTPNFRKTPK
jgi:hypothetical protein